MKEREKSILDNIRLVQYITNTFMVNRNIKEDCFQEGVIGLINAVDTYNKNKKVKLSTYAYKCIRNCIIQYIRKNTNNNISLETEIGDSIFLKDCIPNNEPEIMETLIKEEILNQLYLSLSRLDYFDLFIIESLYGIDEEKFTQKELARKVGCTQSKISKQKANILSKLKVFLEYA